MAPCALCPTLSSSPTPRRAIIKRPKTAQAVCRECFYLIFETEIHHTILGLGIQETERAAAKISNAEASGCKSLGSGCGGVGDESHCDTKRSRANQQTGMFKRGERVAIAASGGKGEEVTNLAFSLHVALISDNRFVNRLYRAGACDDHLEWEVRLRSGSVLVINRRRHQGIQRRLSRGDPAVFQSIARGDAEKLTPRRCFFLADILLIIVDRETKLIPVLLTAQSTLLRWALSGLDDG